jgi:predicted transposase YbfD/YdcC
LLVHPAIAESCAWAIDGVVSDPDVRGRLAAAAVEGPELLGRFDGISDGRSDQGRDHPVAVVLTLCAAAVLAGMRSFTAIAGWVADVPTELLGLLYPTPHSTPPRIHGVPSKTTLWRVLTGVDAGAVDAAIGSWLAGQAHHTSAVTGAVTGARAPDTGPAGRADPADGTGGTDEADGPLLAVAVDGKTVRGAVAADGAQVHLMAAATHGDQLVLGQVEVGAKTNEIPMFAPLIDQLAATGIEPARLVVTADALHCQREHATYLHQRGAGFVFTVKHNQPGLFAALDALPWTDVPITHRQTDRGHGRITTRTIQTLPAPPELPFPHVNQVWLIERYVTDPAGNPTSAIAALGITNLHPDQATPADIARLVRNHWGVESLHWLRDTVYREDDSRARTRAGPRVMTGLRNLSIGALHLAGRRDIAEATRWASRNMLRPFQLLGLTP